MTPTVHAASLRLFCFSPAGHPGCALDVSGAPCSPSERGAFLLRVSPRKRGPILSLGQPRRRSAHARVLAWRVAQAAPLMFRVPHARLLSVGVLSGSARFSRCSLPSKRSDRKPRSIPSRERRFHRAGCPTLPLLESGSSRLVALPPLSGHFNCKLSTSWLVLCAFNFQLSTFNSLNSPRPPFITSAPMSDPPLTLRPSTRHHGSMRAHATRTRTHGAI